ncbi:hypothetical protein ACNSTU_07255 [Aquisalimonas sp. APHAB1-3]|uniref:hypothetical protein n=1 Tax=Aquisalimonas sp. APHAB1-3 TaxID=3402080 RepID=UPI003AAD6BA7
MANEMLEALTRGIGAEVGKPIRVSFFEKERFIKQNEAFQKCAAWRKQLILDVAALSIFHQLIILPYHGAANFYADSKRSGVSRIRMGSQHLDREFVSVASRITRQFFAITKEFQIDVNHLHISNIAEFVDFWIERSKEYG